MKIILFLLLMTGICFADEINFFDQEFKEGHLNNYYAYMIDGSMLDKSIEWPPMIKADNSYFAYVKIGNENQNVGIECPEGYTIQEDYSKHSFPPDKCKNGEIINKKMYCYDGHTGVDLICIKKGKK